MPHFDGSQRDRSWAAVGGARRRDEAGRCRLGRATSSPSPRWKTCTPAHRWAMAEMPTIHVSRRRWSAWPSRPRAATTKPSSPASLHKIVEEDSTLPARPRSADQRAGHDRHERTAPADHPRAAEPPRQARSRYQAAEDSLPRNDSDNRRRELPPQEAIGRPRPVRRGAHPHVSVPARHQARGVLHQGALPAHEGAITTTTSTTSCGSIRSSAARFPATSCRPWKRASRNGWRGA